MQKNIPIYQNYSNKTIKRNIHNNNREEDIKNNNSPISTTSSNLSSIKEKKSKSSMNKENIQNKFSLKNNNINIRKSYSYKLMNKSNKKYNKEVIKNNTLFIFDRDDTLFFTTHLNPSKNSTFFHESNTEKKLMNTIEFYISEILNKALSKGTVLIITNSSNG